MTHPAVNPPARYVHRLSLAIVAATALAGEATYSAEPSLTSQASAASLRVPGYGPGIAGSVTLGPTAPVCTPDQPCEKPYAGVEVVASRLVPTGVVPPAPVQAYTNAQGNFIMSAPPGRYLVRVEVPDGPYPICTTTQTSVGRGVFALVQLACDTGIR